jgi:hypothetical protein
MFTVHYLLMRRSQGSRHLSFLSLHLHLDKRSEVVAFALYGSKYLWFVKESLNLLICVTATSNSGFVNFLICFFTYLEYS